jgi:hypothetical protein
MKLKMDRLLASIFNGFWWVLGANFGSLWQPFGAYVGLWMRFIWHEKSNMNK